MLFGIFYVVKFSYEEQKNKFSFRYFINQDPYRKFIFFLLTKQFPITILPYFQYLWFVKILL